MTELWRALRWYRATTSARPFLEVAGPAGGAIAVEGEIIVADAALPLLDSADVDTWDTLTPAGWPELGIGHYRVGNGESVADAVPRLRAVAAQDPSYDPVTHRIQFNHVLSGEPFYRGGPGTAPQAGTAWTRMPAVSELPAVVAVLDTGFAPGAAADLIGLAVHRTPQDIDALVAGSAPWLGAEAGHGTFIASLILRHVDGTDATVSAVRVLDPDGWGTEDVIITALLRLRGSAALRVVNMSLGGYSDDDAAPALCDAIEALGPQVQVVAAAGNNASDRPFWPAAHGAVVAVAALEGDRTSKAGFSNFGHWVDVATMGRELLGIGAAGSYLDDDAVAVPLGEWYRWSGTSFAAPLVSAEIARRAVVMGSSGPDAWRALETDLGAAGVPQAGVGLVMDPTMFGGPDPSSP